ncbi:MAG: DUF4258 domain-containing protein [Polyangiaceae bacterium]|nr:DUF4258 domain-containing protein [Polyangiaceae bacterium]
MPSKQPLPSSEVLELAKRAAGLRQLRYRRHAHLRMAQRNVSDVDVELAVLSCTRATWRAKEENWKLSGGRDFDGDDLSLGIAVDGATVWICTVF